jgi:hypothetical protein
MKENIIKIKRILKKYYEEQLNPDQNPDDPEYVVNQEIGHKLTMFFNDFSEKQLILNKSEAYLISLLMSLNLLEPQKDHKISDMSFVIKILLNEFPKTLLNAVKLIIIKLRGGLDGNEDSDEEVTEQIGMRFYLTKYRVY